MASEKSRKKVLDFGRKIARHNGTLLLLAQGVANKYIQTMYYAEWPFLVDYLTFIFRN